METSAGALRKMLYKSLGTKRKILTATLLSTLLVSALSGTLLNRDGINFIVQGDTVSGNGSIIDGKPNACITIQSPEHKVYAEDAVALAFTIETDVEYTWDFTGALFDPWFRWGCVLDYDLDAVVDAFTNRDWFEALRSGVPVNNVGAGLSRFGGGYVGNATLGDLSQGWHNVTVWVRVELNYLSYGAYNGTIFSTVSFNVALDPLSISILSPEARAYEASNVSLVFTVNKPAKWIGYSLDGQDNVTVKGNVTLGELSNGLHNVTIYAEDMFGNMGASETISFTVAKPPEPEPFPTTLVVASVITVPVVGIGLLVYFKKRKRWS